MLISTGGLVCRRGYSDCLVGVHFLMNVQCSDIERIRAFKSQKAYIMMVSCQEPCKTGHVYISPLCIISDSVDKYQKRQCDMNSSARHSYSYSTVAYFLSVPSQVFLCDQTFDLPGQAYNQAGHDHDWISLVHLFHSLGPSHPVLAVHCG